MYTDCIQCTVNVLCAIRGLNDRVSLKDKNEKCLRPPQLGHNDPAGMYSYRASLCTAMANRYME